METRAQSLPSLTFITTYYNDIRFIRWWYDMITRVNKQRPGCASLIVVDDGSQQRKAIDFLRPLHEPYISLYYVTEDVGFNSHGCRNLAMKKTTTSWNLLSDIDREYDDSTIFSIIDQIQSGEVEQGTFYQFKNAHGADHSLNEYLVHVDDFWEAGGYDEEFCNIHWGDRLFLQCLGSIAPPVVKYEWVLKYTRGARKVHVQNIDRTQYPDDNTLIHPAYWHNPKFKQGLIDYVTERNKIPYLRKRKPVLNFPWEQLL